MQNHPVIQFHPVKLFSHSGYKHNGEFQTLTLMNGHDANHILPLPRDVCLTKIHLVLFHLLHIPDEIKYPVVACLFKVNRLLQQHHQIGTAPFSGRHGSHIIPISGEKKHLLQNGMYRILLVFPQGAVNLIKSVGSFMFLLLHVDKSCLPEA